MINDEPIIPGGGQSLPLFNSEKPAPFYYRVAYRVRGTPQTLQYTTVHELILNLCCFEDQDVITYVSREDGADFITNSIDQFKVSVCNSFYSTSNEGLELLYHRLYLTNQYSKFISDRGRFKQLDFTLRKYMTTIKGGIDSYLTYENGRIIHYLKYRRLTSIHLLAILIEQNKRDDIHINHINVPRDLSNQDFFEEVLTLHVPKPKVRLYNYDPIPDADNDRIIQTEPIIPSALIQVFNQLLK